MRNLSICHSKLNKDTYNNRYEDYVFANKTGRIIYQFDRFFCRRFQTADVYAHLDFTSKIQSTQIMEAALKLTPDNPQNGISNEAIQAVLLEMKNKGFENIDDFLAFITQETEQKRKKIELYM